MHQHSIFVVAVTVAVYNINGHKRVWGCSSNPHAHRKFSANNEIRIIMTGQYTKCMQRLVADIMRRDRERESESESHAHFGSRYG